MDQKSVCCDSCNEEIDLSTLKFKEGKVKIDNREMTVVYYKCPKCDETYVISLLDYWGKKLQNKYLKSMDAYRKAYASMSDPVKLQQKLRSIEGIKEEALAYQKTLLEKYGDLIPEEALK